MSLPVLHLPHRSNVQPAANSCMIQEADPSQGVLQPEEPRCASSPPESRKGRQIARSPYLHVARTREQNRRSQDAGRWLRVSCPQYLRARSSPTQLLGELGALGYCIPEPRTQCAAKRLTAPTLRQ